MLIVIAEMAAKAGMEERLKQAALALIAPTRAEPDCVQYDLHQHTDEPARLMFYEIWTSREALDRHLQTPHLRGFLEAAADVVAEPPRVMTYHKL
jgi:quinol monooxygenase YgiN